jgi:hypothetical protein
MPDDDNRLARIIHHLYTHPKREIDNRE